MSEIKPQFLDEESYAAKFDRQFFRDILTEGIVATGDLEVTELDTPAMGVKVASGVGYVQGDQAATQGHYRIFNDASKNLTIAVADVTHPRKDRIIAQVYDSIDIGGVDDEWVLEVLTGTPAASPVVPNLPDNTLDLAIVDVEANETTILNADITDQRTQIALQNVSGGAGIGDGWIAVGDTWTYASATTITVPSGAASIYQIGDKIKLTQTTVKYFYIVGVADTLLTIIGGDDYTLVDAAIISPYYSKIENPQGFPFWLSWVPTYGAGGSMTYTSVITEVAKFKIIGKTFYFVIYCNGTTGGTASTSLTFTIPVDIADGVSMIGGTCYAYDGSATSGIWYNNQVDSIAVLKYNAANWGLGAGRRIRMQTFYRIA